MTRNMQQEGVGLVLLPRPASVVHAPVLPSSEAPLGESCVCCVCVCLCSACWRVWALHLRWRGRGFFASLYMVMVMHHLFRGLIFVVRCFVQFV